MAAGRGPEMLARLKSVFLPVIDVEKAEDATGIIRAGLLVIAVAFVGVGGWLAFAPLSGAVIAEGAVKVLYKREIAAAKIQQGGHAFAPGQAPHTGSSGLNSTLISLFGTTGLPLSWSSMRRRSAAISNSAKSPSSRAISR